MGLLGGGFWVITIWFVFMLLRFVVFVVVGFWVVGLSWWCCVVFLFCLLGEML